MDIKLRVTPEALKSKASEVESDIRTLEKHFNSIQDIAARTSGYWAGAAGDKARKEFGGQKEDTAKVIGRFREHPVKLLTMAGIYDENEKALVAENQKLVTDVIA